MSAQSNGRTISLDDGSKPVEHDLGGTMFLRHRPSNDLVEILELEALFDPFRREAKGRFHAGEEMPGPAGFTKTDLVFPSGERLPRCWVDPHYRK
jgi:hypothetical protein